MNSFYVCKPSCCNYYFHSPFHSNKFKLHNHTLFLPFHSPKITINNFAHFNKFAVRAFNNVNDDDDDDEDKDSRRRGFLSLEEAGLVEISGLSAHERFLCRLTISSLNLLRVIGDEEGCRIEELNAGKICDWFLKDKLKREQNIGSAVLQWEDDDPFDLQS